MTPQRFRAICAELADENPFAVRAVLKVLRTEFTETVPTLAVTLDKRPRLLVNLKFVAEHCLTEAHVKAVICHEFLHVVLRHTERFDKLEPADHLALDAVINAIIHRTLGPEYSDMMSRYYARNAGVRRLLRPGTPEEYYDRRESRGLNWRDPVLVAWRGLYKGDLVADDIADLARDLQRNSPNLANRLIGGHNDARGALEALGPLPEALREAIERALKAMNGDGIWRSPRERGIGASAYQSVVNAADVGFENWRRETFAVLKKHLAPDPRAQRTEPQPYEYGLPVLSGGDRRAALRAMWNPLLPEALWRAERPGRPASAQVYLDVSGSMNAEMPLIVALLAKLSRHIRRPFWAFSDMVAPAVIKDGQLVTGTTGGTSMACVLEHLAETRPAAAVVVTDGYIEQLQPHEVAVARGTRLHAIVTRNGNPAQLAAAGIPYTQLSRLPA
jgi:hypothetical protein